MAGKKKSREEPQKILKGKIVLPEVIQAIEETGQPVNVICAMVEGKDIDIEDVIKFLDRLKIDVNPKREAHTDYYVFATLQGMKDVEKIEASAKKDQRQYIYRVWLDKKIQPLVKQSQKTINAEPARNLFASAGEGVHWAVIDTGVDIGHAWFAPNQNCDASRRKDFTGTGLNDVGMHGTHVAGIITTIAPKVKIHDYKVLAADGGQASWIIKAMHDIRRINFEAGTTVIHGANLSLGGAVPVGSYGCGWSPECQEANRLMASGVVVCIAAGNDGHKSLATVGAQNNLVIYKSYLDLSITDPGNAEAVITVGSTHKTQPHNYGPSFFSSKGPTGDGRCKPDCLAPGEKIVSAKAGGGTIEMDGTSMATPHVSGAIALFLSVKTEYMGQAPLVKKILLDSCTDLGRDRYFQGAGLIDILRMIQSV